MNTSDTVTQVETTVHCLRRSLTRCATMAAAMAILADLPAAPVFAQGPKGEGAVLSILGAAAATAEARRANPDAAAKLNLNIATREELQTLPGVDEALAKKIVAGRPYAAVGDLARAGVPIQKIRKIKPLVVAEDAVWVNTSSGIFHRPGDHWYGKTAEGRYMTEAEAIKTGYKPLEEPKTKKQ